MMTAREVYKRTYQINRAIQTLQRKLRDKRMRDVAEKDVEKQIGELKARLQGLSRYCWDNVVTQPDLLNAYWGADRALTALYEFDGAIKPKNTSEINWKINTRQPEFYIRTRRRPAVAS